MQPYILPGSYSFDVILSSRILAAMKTDTNSNPKHSKRLAILVAATVGLLSIAFLLRRESVPPKSKQIDKGLVEAPVSVIQPISAPPLSGLRAMAPVAAIKQEYPKAKSLDLIPPSPPSKAEHLRILVVQVLRLELPKELGWKEGFPEIRMQPAEAQKLLNDLASLSRSSFTIPGVISGLASPHKDRVFPNKGFKFDSTGFARVSIYLETGGSIFRDHPFESGDSYSLAINPMTGVVKLIFYPGVIRDDQ